MDVGVLDQRFSLSEYWQGKSLVSRVGGGCDGTQETTAMLFAYTNATLLLKWSKERSDV